MHNTPLISSFGPAASLDYGNHKTSRIQLANYKSSMLLPRKVITNKEAPTNLENRKHIFTLASKYCLKKTIPSKNIGNLAP
jgi:hypothetical protein